MVVVNGPRWVDLAEMISDAEPPRHDGRGGSDAVCFDRLWRSFHSLSGSVASVVASVASVASSTSVVVWEP